MNVYSAGQPLDVPPLEIINSPTNPRKKKGLDIDSLNAMAASITKQGVMSPIIVRPLPATRLDETVDLTPRPGYEIIAGERRWRGACLAGIPVMPVLVREDLDDEQVHQMQLVENIEREDLDPLEEAEAFQLLREKYGYTVEQIAAKITEGKGPSYVYKRITLNNLVQEVRDATYEDPPLDISLALLVARYEHDAQPDALDYLRGMKVNGHWPSFRTAQPALAKAFHMVLAKAPFDIHDASLIAGVPSCMGCPKRTGAQGDIFGDAAEPDSCPDSTCFQEKREAHAVQLRTTLAKQGYKVIDGAEAMAAKNGMPGQSIRGWQRLDEVAFVEEGKDGVERDVTFKDALAGMGKKAPKPRMFIDPHSLEAIPVISVELADKLTPPADLPAPKVKQPTNAAADAHDMRTPLATSSAEDAIANHHVERAVLTRMFDAIRSGPRTERELRLVARALFFRTTGEEDDLPLRAERYLGWSADLEEIWGKDLFVLVGEKIDALPIEDLAQAIAMAALDLFVGCHWTTDEQILDLAKTYGIDVLAVRDKVAEDMEA